MVRVVAMPAVEEPAEVKLEAGPLLSMRIEAAPGGVNRESRNGLSGFRVVMVYGEKAGE